MEIRLAKQSPSGHRLNTSNTNIRKEEPLATTVVQLNNNLNNKFSKTQKNPMLNSSKK